MLMVLHQIFLYITISNSIQKEKSISHFQIKIKMSFSFVFQLAGQTLKMTLAKRVPKANPLCCIYYSKYPNSLMGDNEIHEFYYIRIFILCKHFL